ncbi:uncharacterized protein B0H18DRAFT_953294 [Fomitopsis serialis]|uniref:uncharacterized protein n=1 Tax=Fomitopsis serialis TaxID=139415 RepID=UPI0020075D1E|nr:uncharacterized protein B0H18DRAFT_953294 [Neoantrodia serialis]KAH9930018.1 hypothetical protein B0H18DRAFT_953294 [Neoantrodia serialis]
MPIVTSSSPDLHCWSHKHNAGDTIALKDGNHIPTVASGTWRRGNGKEAIENVSNAVSILRKHKYAIEAEAGAPLRSGGLRLFITTKFSSGADIDTSVRNSYEAHAKPDIPTIWKKMEAMKIVCVGEEHRRQQSQWVNHLKTLLESTRLRPAANQIMIHPQVMHLQAPIVEFCQKEGITVEEQVLVAWSKLKNAVAVTYVRRHDQKAVYL